MAGMKVFEDYLKQRSSGVKALAAAHLSPERLIKMVLFCVSRTPKLMECTMESILRSMLQCAELNLDLSPALGEAYLVPYKGVCQLITGYQGLITLAHRAGFVNDVEAREVYDGDVFEYEYGLNRKLKHIPGDNSGDVEKLTHAYCIVYLSNGEKKCDVMSKRDIERIRARSASGSSGPWVTDTAEMWKKTATRRTLKYVPKSSEMSKALSLDDYADTQDESLLEFDVIDAIQTDQPERKNGVGAMKEKLGVKPEESKPAEIIEAVDPDQATDQDDSTETSEEEPEITKELRVLVAEKMATVIGTAALRRSVVKSALDDDKAELTVADMTHDQLVLVNEKLDAIAASRNGNGKQS
jgi:recombination protein RecT